MEEADTGGTEPVDLRCAEQAELLSLIISGDEEATREDSDLEDGACLANGHADKNSETATATAVKSPGTSYWSITEGPDHPLLLTISPGKARAPRGSRQTISRIPGRDHRRYYHEYWRSEYLMDFDSQRQSMVCMVCGSFLATLKLSTIKRHIRQKHPDSLLWSAADKDVIRSGWDSHLNISGGQAFSSAETTATEGELLLSSQPAAAVLDGGTPQDCSQDLSLQCSGQSPSPEDEAQPQPKQEQDTADPLAQTLEQYLNDSLHAWFRQEFLMKYDGEAGRLQCMVCGVELPSLHLEHIKRHVLDTHPSSLVYSSEEKHCILQAWAQTHEELENPNISETTTKESTEDLFAQDEKPLSVKSNLHQQEDGSSAQGTCLIGEDGAVGAPQITPPPQAPTKRGRKPRKARLRGGNPWRLRLDYLVAYGPQGKGTYCMVCSEILHETKVSSFRRHIQEAHPETTTLSREEREAMAAAWTKDYSTDGQEGEEDQLQRLSSSGTGTNGGTPGVSGGTKQ
ncbi:zinc finger translocation-associated protein isoform X2 [Boleophthalmus pectinirostris]|uniref:zinc finger translocation-associated protein isoform X2 n=1 Tax=Boleophthalmus pectinirostris TaxID=150288 RepID=UPI002432861A|nr:zinc finger translocation-associated protein isoform X2 [Boleophthalmus pectinirostris]